MFYADDLKIHHHIQKKICYVASSYGSPWLGIDQYPDHLEWLFR